MEKMQQRAKSHAQELEELFAEDAAEQAKSAKEPAAERKGETDRTGEKPTPVS